MSNFLGNAFSINMLREGMDLCLTVRMTMRRITPESVPEDCISVIGHSDTASVVSSVLGREIAANRQTLVLDEGDELYVAQYSGPRLAEGATELPDGAKIEFWRVRIVNIDDLSA